jgi:protein O-mannosyl-transferase
LRQKKPARQPPAAALRGTWPRWLLLLAVLAVTLTAYYPAWFGGPLWDDDRHMTAPALQSLEGLWRIWFEIGATQQYYPLVHSAFWIQHQLWGDHTLGYHLVNIVLHAIAAGFVWAILRRLEVPGAAVAGIVFALHPIHVESVAWITELKNTLSGVLVLWALLRYLDYDADRGWRAYASALALFVLALLSKTVTAVLPAALLVIVWWRRGAIDLTRDVRPLVPFFALGTAGGLLTAWVERTHIGAQGAEFAFSFVERCLIAGRVVWFYLGKLLWPAELIFTYPRWDVSQGVWWQYLYPIAALAALWAIRHRSRAPLAAALLFGGILFPVLGFFNVYPFRFSFVADHFAYLASIPVIALVVATAGLAARRWDVRGPAVRAAAAVLVSVLAVLTFQQSRHYADAETLYRETVRRNPSSWMAHINLGMLLLERDPAEALRRFDEAIRLNPRIAEAHLDKGNALQRLGRTKEAIASYLDALALDPNMPKVHNNLSSALLSSKEPALALEHAEAAILLDPDYAWAHHAAGAAARALGRHDEALRHFRDALDSDPSLGPVIRPDIGVTLNARGMAVAEEGRIDEAIALLRQSIDTLPDYAAAHFNLGNLLQGAGRFEEALPHYQVVLKMNAGDATAHNNLGAALEALGRREQAAAHYREAVRLAPGSELFRTNLFRVAR